MEEIKKKMDEFNRRWSINNALDYKTEFGKFKTRILNLFNDIDRHVKEEGISLFCNILGIEEKWHSGYSGTWSSNIKDSLTAESNEKEFYRLLEIIFCLPIQKEFDSYRPYSITYSKDILYVKTKELIEISNINLSLTRKNEDIIFYPKGETEFDKQLVNQVLTFLDENSQKHFVEALKFYQVGSQKNYIKSAEELRRSLEEFLRHKLKNIQGLDKNITELNKKLKEDKRDPVIRNIISQVFSYLDQYFNENSKHRDGDINNIENEFLIYQIGILMRYIEFNLGK